MSAVPVCKSPYSRPVACLLATLMVLMAAASSPGQTTAPVAPQRVPAQVGADFWIDGQYPGLSFPSKLPNLKQAIDSHALVVWGSWCGSGDRVGQICLGPFVATGHFYLAVAGKPFDEGNVLKIVRKSDHAEYIVTRDTPGETWQQVEVNLPASWEGSEVEIFASDVSHTDDGWLAFTEPFAVGSDGSIQPLWKNRDASPRITYWLGVIVPFTVDFIALGVVGLAGCSMLRRFLRTDPCLTPLLIAAVIGLMGYATFWAFLYSVAFGRGIACFIFFGSVSYCGFCLLVPRWILLHQRDWTELKFPVLIVWIAALFYIGILHFARTEGIAMDVLASRRPMVTCLASDNVLQQEFSKAIFYQRGLKSTDTTEWQASDRPPLQGGVQLLTGTLFCDTMHEEPQAGELKLHWNINAQNSGMVLQLSWVFGVWALLRTLGCSRKVASRIILCLLATPLFYINTVFVWAKLSAGAFAVGSVILLCLRGQRPLAVPDAVVAGSLLSLGMLCHTGIFFFAIPVIGLWLLFPITAKRPGIRPLAASMIAAFAVFFPWTCYQKFVDPPGNHLIKLSLTGVNDNNPVSTTESIRVAYASITIGQLFDNKAANFQTMFRGDWNTLFSLFPADRGERRESGFLYLFRSMGLYILGFAALPALLLRKNRDKMRPIAFLLGSIAVALVIWCLVMFGPGTTIVHAGAYGIPMVMLALLTYLLWMVHPAVLYLMAVCNLIQFLDVYLWTFPYPPRTDELAIVSMVTALVLAIVLIRIKEIPAFGDPPSFPSNHRPGNPTGCWPFCTIK